MEMLRRLVLVLGLALPCSLLSYPKSSQLYYLFWGVVYAIVFPYYFFLNITLKEHSSFCLLAWLQGTFSFKVIRCMLYIIERLIVLEYCKLAPYPSVEGEGGQAIKGMEGVLSSVCCKHGVRLRF